LTSDLFLILSSFDMILKKLKQWKLNSAAGM